MTGVATYAQEAVLQPAAFQVILEFPLNVTREFRALGHQMGGECRVMLLDDLIEQRLF